MCEWVNDTQRFLLEHFDTIHNSPSQIYHSALLFSPPSSWLQKCYGVQSLNKVKVVKGLPVGWGKCSRIISFPCGPQALSFWKNTIAVGLGSGNIMILDAITGNHAAVFSGHTKEVRALSFSSNGILLASGSLDHTVKLWDVQTGGVIKSFHGHRGQVNSISISADSTVIASGSDDATIHLWNIQTKESCHIIKQQERVEYLCFSPIDPQHLVFVSDHNVQNCDINGDQIGPRYNGSYIAFSTDGSMFALCNEEIIIVHSTRSRKILAEFHAASDKIGYCCFSPDGRVIAAAAGITVYVWDITSLNPHPIETLNGHTSHITGLAFSSSFSLISLSHNGSVRFWEISPLPSDQVVSDSKLAPVTSVPIRSITLKPRNGIAISSDEGGVVKIWDIFTGLCKESFQTPAIGAIPRDVQLVNGKPIIAWTKGKEIHIWDIEKSELLQTVAISEWQKLRISEDGSMIFCYLDWKFIQARALQTGEPIGELKLENNPSPSYFYLDGSKVGVLTQDSLVQGWDFGAKDTSSAPSPTTLIPNPYLEFVSDPVRVKDKVTGNVVFQLPAKYQRPCEVQWSGQYLVAGYKSGEVVILNLCHLYPQHESMVYHTCGFNCDSMYYVL